MREPIMNNPKPNFKLNETIMITPTTEAYIDAICIRTDRVSYELAFMDDLYPKYVWFDEDMIERILYKAESAKA